jgi:hypothetical protein
MFKNYRDVEWAISIQAPESLEKYGEGSTHRYWVKTNNNIPTSAEQFKKLKIYAELYRDI